MIGRLKSLMAKLLGGHDRHVAGNGGAAHRADVDAGRKLAQTRRGWAEVNQAHDLLAEWIESALRGGR